MATPSLSLDETLKQMREQQDLLLKQVEALQKPGKDLWDKMGALSGLLIALVGGLFSYLYSSQQARESAITQNHQTKLEEVQTVGTFMPYLVGKDDPAKSIALSEVENLLDAPTAVLIAEHINSAQTAAGTTVPDPVVLKFLQNMAANGKTQAGKDLANKALSKIQGKEAPR